MWDVYSRLNSVRGRRLETFDAASAKSFPGVMIKRYYIAGGSGEEGKTGKYGKIGVKGK